MQSKTVIYTAIFGQRDRLQEPTYIPEGVDFVCFTDQPFISKVWQIRKVKPLFPEDLTRSNRYYKILAHKMFPEYMRSVYLDGNVVVTGKIEELLDIYLEDAHFAAFDCRLYSTMPIHSVNEEAMILMTPRQEVRNKESGENIKKQLDTYLAEGFPDNNGCIMGMVLLRKHHEPDVVEAMEAWWHEVLTKSKRDLMSFNYVAWKYKFRFNYIPLDGANNPYVTKVRHHTSFLQKLRFRIASWLHVLQKKLTTVLN